MDSFIISDYVLSSNKGTLLIDLVFWLKLEGVISSSSLSALTK
jgi:hypothetical protein